MNTVTSLFVDATMQYSANDEDAQIQDQLQSKQTYIAKLEQLFESIDGDGTAEVSHDEFILNLSQPHMMGFAESLGIPIVDLEQFFNILSVNGTKSLDLNTFVVGCIKLRGMAKSMDMMDVLINVRKGNQDLSRFITNSNSEFQTIRMMLQGFATL